MRSLHLGLHTMLAACLGLVVACQAYNMEEVDAQTVVAVETYGTYERSKPPSLLVIQDRSFSMEICFDQDAYPGPTRGCGMEEANRVLDRRSRMEVSQQVMGQVVESSKEDVQFGLVLYGVNEASPKANCAPPLTIAEPSATSYREVAEAYASNPYILAPNGGTPTTEALRRAFELLIDDSDPAGSKPRDPQRQSYVVLVTDGLMNCNASHPVPCICASESDCFGPNGMFPYGVEGTPAEAIQCLDDDDAVSEVRRLAAAGIKTFVIGLGESFSGEEVLASQVLDELAVAGGVPQEGAPQKFYSAGNSDQLQGSLEAIIQQISAPCDYILDGPVCDGRLVKVGLRVDGETVETSCTPDEGESSWFFAAKEGGGLDERRIIFSPDLCQRMALAEKVEISIRGVENACGSDPDAPPGPACSLAEAP